MATRDLFEAVYDRPDDDEPRVALAAHLTKRGDPRGQFITIQLAEAAGAATPAMSRKAVALLKKHEAAWLEPYDIINQVRWARGFPVHAFAVVFGNQPRPWRTIRSLVVDIDTRYRFLRGPLVEHLRELTWRGWYPSTFAPFARAARLPMLETLRWCGPEPSAPEAWWRKGYQKLSKFKRLTTLELERALVGSYPWFWDSKVTRRLTHLILAADLASAGDCVSSADGLEGLRELTLKDKAGAPEDPEHTFAARFSRSTAGALSVCEVTTHKKPLDSKELAGVLARLMPDQLTSFRLVGSKKLPPDVEDALERQERLRVG